MSTISRRRLEREPDRSAAIPANRRSSSRSTSSRLPGDRRRFDRRCRLRGCRGGSSSACRVRGVVPTVVVGVGRSPSRATHTASPCRCSGARRRQVDRGGKVALSHRRDVDIDAKIDAIVDDFANAQIRDEIAASKKKGLWMGGVVPLGYWVENRALHRRRRRGRRSRWPPRARGRGPHGTTASFSDRRYCIARDFSARIRSCSARPRHRFGGQLCRRPS